MNQSSAVEIGQLYRKARGSALDTIRYAIQWGNALEKEKASVPHGQWLKWLQANEETLGFGERTARRLLAFASNRTLASDLEQASSNLLEQLWGHPNRVAALYSSKSVEWKTPSAIVNRAENTLGRISLDPCADEARSVPAENHCTITEDGLTARWFGTVYMNPPHNEIADWVKKLCDEYSAGHVQEAIALVPARTDTAWFQLLDKFAVCFVRGRLRFNESRNSAPFPSALVYLGEDIAKFAAAFGDLGCIRVPWAASK